MHVIPGIPVLTFLLAALPSQNDRVFHLPAGDHRLGELLARCEQAVKSPIARGRIDNLDERRPVRLQRDLALPTDAWEDVLASVLFAHDLVLTFDAEEKRHEVLPMPTHREQTGWTMDRAQPMSLGDFTARSGYQGPVRLQMQATPQLASMIAVNILGPLVVTLPGGLLAAAESDKVTLTGLAVNVRAALAMLASLEPALAQCSGATTAPTWPRAAAATTHSLPAGKHTLGAIVDALALATDRNLLLGAATPTNLEFTTVAPIRGDAHAFEDALTKLLWTQHVVVLGLAPAHGLFVVQQVSQRARPTAHQATAKRAEEVLARPDLVAYVEVAIRPQHVAPDVLTGIVSKAMRTAPHGVTATEMWGTQDGIVLRGYTHDLAPLLQQMRDADHSR